MPSAVVVAVRRGRTTVRPVPLQGADLCRADAAIGAAHNSRRCREQREFTPKGLSMARWWVRFPIHNLDLGGPVTLDALRIVPVMSCADSRKAVRNYQWTAEPFVHTADAIVNIGEHTDRPSNAYELAWSSLGPVIGAAEFLWQRDLRVSEWYVHGSDECGDEPAAKGYALAFCDVPYGPPVQVFGSEADALRAGAKLWADSDTAEQTAFRYAIALQHAGMGRFVLTQMEFLHQWMALEVLFNRWSDMPDSCVSDVVVAPEVRKRLKTAVKEEADRLVAEGKLAGATAPRMSGFIRKRLTANAAEKAQAFLQHHAIGDVPKCWIRDCCELRNAIVHGRPLSEWYSKHPPEENDEPYQDLHWRTLRVRELVNRYVMSLMGYEPRRWSFEDMNALY